MDSAVNLPTNGALMTREQLDELETGLAASGTPRERAMFYQMQAMIRAAGEYRRLNEHERRCRMEAERKEGEYVMALRNMQTILQQSRARLNKQGLLDLMNLVKAEVDTALEETD